MSVGDPSQSRDLNQKTPPKGTTKMGLLQSLGPGLITGASDDDPSGIATYSQVGAQFGYGLLWTMLFSYPLMVGIQEISAQIGRVTGRGIAGNLRRHYAPGWLYSMVGLVLIANIINLGADIGAMGDVVTLLVGGPALLYAVLFAAVSAGLETLLPYARYARVLKWMTLALFAYVATVFVVHVPWKHALIVSVVPGWSWKSSYITSVVAVLGTTISPYLFFWQAESEVELERASPKEWPLRHDPASAGSQLHRIRVDTYAGMAFSNLVAYFIILTAAATLWATGHTDIETSTQAAAALGPIAGPFARLLFALGIVGTGLLALPVLAGSAAYAVGEALRWPVGLNQHWMQARGFYGVITGAMLLGLGLNFVHIDPIKALFWSAVINGVVAGPIMILMMLMASSRRIMGHFTLNARQMWLGWAATSVMLAATSVMLAAAAGLFATWGQ